MAKVTLVFEGENAAELQKAVADYVGQTTASVSGAAPAKEAVRSAAPAKKAGKAVEKEPEPTPAVEPEPEENPFDTDEDATPEAPALTFESVTAALKEVGEKVGVTKVREILAAVNIKKAKELDQKNFQKVMDACTKALA